jgi:hypothetical protein
MYAYSIRVHRTTLSAKSGTNLATHMLMSVHSESAITLRAWKAGQRGRHCANCTHWLRSGQSGHALIFRLWNY